MAAAAAADSPPAALSNFVGSNLPSLTLHAYHHCPFCVRVQLVLGWLKVQHQVKNYGYGLGADPDQCAGHGYGAGGGPVLLTGKKELPVLSGEQVPVEAGTRGMSESLRIVSYATSLAPGKGLAPATNRADVQEWMKKLPPALPKLLRTRLFKMPLKDFADERDVAYFKWNFEKNGFDFAAAEAETPALVAVVSGLFSELDAMLNGTSEMTGGPCLNAWGIGVDDVLLIPVLRNLTCVAGLQWPPKLREYVETACAAADVELYTKFAI
eukprot:CAMPEP_0183332920 /NCGR_PEP_ID=MMETSP0164_2-20130417/1976_1 /TAXON_ID=221442 /ORGANISM="Coccolithus pelagicus ssp braarudi, Strain PLY182g" /LENGTH=267 /DNA_ID=CAMNT_0025501735 /DNA_START=8 /DNA_END=811 /DNA_ORIENTATION=+